MLLLRNNQLEHACPCSYLNLGGEKEVIRVAAVILQAFVIFITEVGYKSSLPVAIFANCANCLSSNSSQIFQTGLCGLSLQKSSAVALLMLSTR